MVVPVVGVCVSAQCGGHSEYSPRTQGKVRSSPRCQNHRLGISAVIIVIITTGIDRCGYSLPSLHLGKVSSGQSN